MLKDIRLRARMGNSAAMMTKQQPHPVLLHRETGMPADKLSWRILNPTQKIDDRKQTAS
jgi:hypothetical protein